MRSMVPLATVAFVAFATLACRTSTPSPARIAWPDAPVDMRDDADRDQAIDAVFAMPAGAGRDRARARIVHGAAQKIGEALDANEPDLAIDRLEQLVSLWAEDPPAIRAGLAGEQALLERMRARFAKSGPLAAVALVLVVLSEIDDAKRTAYRAELDDVLAFADETAIADGGLQAKHGQPILVLQPAALVLPLPWLVDRYVQLLEVRQATITTIIAQHGATVDIIRAHPDLLRTHRRIANALARAGRAAEIHAHLAKVVGIGSDRELAARAEVVAVQPTAMAYAELATALRTVERHDDARSGRAPDHLAALATLRTALAKFAADPTLLAAAGGDARVLGRIEQPIALYTAALMAASEVDASDALRLGRLHAERISRASGAGRPSAARAAWHDVTTFVATASRKHPHPVWGQVMALGESALGRGLLALGLVADAEVALRNSIERAPSIDAFESLATLHLQLGKFDDARRWVEGGLALLDGTTSGDRYRRAKLERLAADIARRANKPDGRDPRVMYLDSIRTFASLGEDKDLPRSIAAERMLERGRALWWIGDQNGAAEAVLAAVELDAAAPAIATSAVGFLLQVGRFGDAVDAVHAALGSAAPETNKTYVSMWILGDAKRRGEAPDRLATEFLQTRHGSVWHELLAAAATGRGDPAKLRAAATTGPRRAELAFYSATLDLDPALASQGDRALFEEVVRAQLVMDAEYDLARAYLGR